MHESSNNQKVRKRENKLIDCYCFIDWLSFVDLDFANLLRLSFVSGLLS